MKKTIFSGISVIGLLFFCLLAAAPVFSQTAAQRKPSIAVVNFDVKTSVSSDVGRELSDLLVNALIESQRFTVVDRTQMMANAQVEQMIALGGATDPATGAAVGKLIGAQFLVAGSITEFNEKQGVGVGTLGKWLPIPGNNKIGTYKAVVKFNIKVINSTTGEIALSKPFEKTISTAGLVSDGTVYDFVGFKSKAMQDAVAGAMDDAVAVLVERIGSYIPPNSASSEASTASTADCSRFSGAKAPRVMVVIPEIHITQRIPDPAGETEIIKKLVQRGFNVVDQRQIAAIRDRERVLAATKNIQIAAALGAEFGADIIIIGEAFSELARRDQNLISTRARVEAKAIQTDTARILAADGKFGSGLDIAEFVSAKAALRNAGTQWADYFIAQVCQSSNVIETGSPSARPMPSAPIASPIEIMVSNINYTQLKTLGDRLAQIPGARNVVKKVTGNVGRIDVMYDGSAENLADAISTTTFGLMRVNIVGLTGNKIEITVGK